MSTVLRQDGFRVVVFLPPGEHEPPHVHVQNGDGEVVIDLVADARCQRIRQVAGMKDADVVKAYWLVAEHEEYLLTCWRRYHG